jgi:outer membrane protein assembly factor BamB
VAGSAALGEAADGASWPQWRGPNRDGVSTEKLSVEGLAAGKPKTLWEKSVGKGYSSVSVAKGRLYTMGGVGADDVVWCLEADTGKDVWQHKYACSGRGRTPGPRMTPTVDGDVVFTLSREGHLFCLAAKDGAVKWSTNIQADYGVRQTKYKWGLSCSPIVLGEKLIVTAGKALAFNKADGKLLWKSGGDSAAYSSPVPVKAGDKACVTSFTEAALVLVSVADGTEVARSPWKTSWGVNAATPIVSGDKIFLSTGYKRGCTLLQVGAGGLTRVYENENMRNHCQTSVLWKGHLYGIDDQQGRSGKLVCMEFATGNVKWSAGGFKVGGGLFLADEKLVFMADGGELRVAAAAPDAYKELGKAKVLSGQCWTTPVLAAGKIYCRSAKGDLVCVSP